MKKNTITFLLVTMNLADIFPTLVEIDFLFRQTKTETTEGGFSTDLTKIYAVDGSSSDGIIMSTNDNITYNFKIPFDQADTNHFVAGGPFFMDTRIVYTSNGVIAIPETNIVSLMMNGTFFDPYPIEEEEEEEDNG